MKSIEEILQDKARSRLLLQAFQTILANTDSMLFLKDADLVYQAANMNFVRLVGKNCAEDVVGHTDFEIFDDQMLAQRYVSDDRKIFAGDQDVISYIEPIPNADSRPRFARTSKYVLRDSKGKIIGLAGISRDITREIVAAEDHQKEISYLFNLPEKVFLAVYVDVTDWRIIGERQRNINNAYFRPHENADVLRHKACNNIPDTHSEAYDFYNKLSPEFMQEIYNSGRRSINMEYLRRFESGEERWVQDEISLLVDPENNHLCFMLTVHDIHARKLEELNLHWAAERDEMTGMFNRASLIRHIKDYLAGEGQNHKSAIFLIDIDNFKLINDTYGHQSGDRFISHIAKTIRGNFRDSDLVGRIGGDEFLILMKNVPNTNIVRDKGRDLLDALEGACHEIHDFSISGSIGISLYDTDGKEFEQLYEKADRAMYHSKHHGKARLSFAHELEEN